MKRWTQKLLPISRGLWIGLTIGGLAAALNEPSKAYLVYCAIAAAALVVLFLSYTLEDE